MSFELVVILYFVLIIVRLYLDIMQVGYVSERLQGQPVLMEQERYMEAGRYEIASKRLSIVTLLAEGALFLFWIAGGLSWLEEAVEPNTLLSMVLFFLLFLGVNYVVMLPFEIYRIFEIEKRFGFSRVTPGLFVVDELKKIALTVIFGGAMLAAIFWIMSHLPYWWAWGALVLVVLLFSINLIYPLYIAPLFNTFKPLPEGELSKRINDLLRAHGLDSGGLFVVDASKRDSRLNAYFAGFGRVKRVVLYDTLIEKLTVDEVVAVLGHELGHLRNRDLWVRLVTSSIVVIGLFVLSGNLPDKFFMSVGVAPLPSAKLALIWLLTQPLMFMIMPLLNRLYRHAEFAADTHGAALAGAEILASALKKLGYENKKFPYTHPLYEAIYYSHPSLLRRLEVLGHAS
ncbi:MAG: M48 family metallopeptidase [Campylobacterales bacterium]